MISNELCRSTAIGIDIGGTNYRIALVNQSGNILKIIQKSKNHRLLDLNSNLVSIRQDFELLSNYAKENDLMINGVGFAVGCLVGRDFTISSASSPEILPETKVDLIDLFPEIKPEKIVMENDSKAAAFGELSFGAGKGFNNLICLTIGTGIGGGIILDGKLLHGANGYAGHVGFMPIMPYNLDGPPKQKIYFEEWASGSAIYDLALEGLKSGETSNLREKLDGDYSQLNSKLVFYAAENGDQFSKDIINEVARILGIGIASLIHMFNPDVVILGGGVSEQGDLLFDPVQKTVKDVAMLRYCNTPIIPAQLGNNAGVIGAASLTGF